MAKRKQWNPNKALTKANSKGGFYNSKGQAQQDKFAPIYLSLVDSKPYRTLNTTQKQLFTYMVMQVPNRKLEKTHGKNAFYFNRAIQNNFGLKCYRQNIKNIKVLAEKGFIEIVEDNHHNKKKNVYRLVSDWQRKE